MKMTFDEYIKNPMGKDNSVFSKRGMYKDLYTGKFDAILAREAGNIDFMLYKSDDSKYTIHIKIPSEVVEKFYYDVVIEFSTKEKFDFVRPTLSNYDVKFFSNDPAFVFTFAYSFVKNNIFIKELSPKMSKAALENKAVVRNPKNEVGYVKSLYFAYLYMKNRGLFNKATWLGATPYNVNTLLRNIQNADTKIAMRQKLGEEVIKQKTHKSSNTNPSTHSKKIGIGKNIESPSATVRVYKKKPSGNIRRASYARKVKKTSKR